MKDWTSEIIDDLCRAKAAGSSFEAAWDAAYRAHRPGRRDAGAPCADLFEAARQEESIPEFLRRVAEDAWKNRRPELARLQVLAESDVFPVLEVLPSRRGPDPRYGAAA